MPSIFAFMFHFILCAITIFILHHFFHVLSHFLSFPFNAMTFSWFPKSILSNAEAIFLCQGWSQFSSCCEPAVLCSSPERWLSVRLLLPLDQSGPPAVCLVKPVSQSGCESVCHNACHLILASRSIRRTPVHLNPTTWADQVEHFFYKTI